MAISPNPAPLANSITNAMLQNNAVTSGKINFANGSVVVNQGSTYSLPSGNIQWASSSGTLTNAGTSAGIISAPNVGDTLYFRYIN